MSASSGKGKLQLSASKKALLEAMLLEEGLAPLPQARIEPRRGSASGSLPLAFAQQRLWFLDQLGAGASYNMPFFARLRGGLRIDALRRSFVEILRRHEALRTSFPEVGGEPVQILADDPRLLVPLLDLSALDEPKRWLELKRLAAAESATLFDLARGPLVRVRVVRLASDDHVLLLVLHHIVSDGWSMSVLTRELSAFYEAFASGRDPGTVLPPLPIQYADFADWQRQWLSGPVLKRQLDYWREQLEDVSALELATDRPRSSRTGSRGGRVSRALPGELLAPLDRLGNSERATRFMVLLAAFQALLHRYTEQEDVVVGTAIANRNRPEIEGLIGFFVNALALRVRLGGSLPFRELLARVREVCLGAYSNQDLPFEHLVETLQPDRDLSRNPMFQVTFAVQNTPPTSGELGALAMRPVDLADHHARFDLELHLWERPEGLLAVAFYRADLFDRATIERLLAHYQNVLRAVASDPGARLSSLPLVDEAERSLLLHDWNTTGTAVSWSRSVVDRFEEQASLRPGALAACSESESDASGLSYGELNERANRLAHALMRLGVGPEVKVGLVVERSPRLLVAILGITKAGGAYVALDPDNPPERIGFMLESSDARVLVSESAVLDHLEPRPPIPTLSLDGDGGRFAVQSAQNPARAKMGPETLAYVIYTSGSTGSPKGVGVSHRGLANLCQWHQDVYGVTSSDRATQVAGLGFDASVWEVWPYLISGASLHFPDEETRLAPVKLLGFLASRRITLSFLPTPLAEAVLAEAIPADGLSLRALLTGGDKLSRPPRPGLSFELVNHYGPTESSVVATWTDVPPSSRWRPDTDAPPPIGRPIANVRLYVLDAELSPLPLGVPGELYVGGAGVARGYLGHPDATASRFLPDPFGGELGGRLYRTGDRVRYRADGRVEFLGRIDHQVKLRGYRVELGEIESNMQAFPGVREAAVMVRDDPGSGKRLVGYLAASAASASRGGEEEIQQERVSRWRETYDDVVYAELDSRPGASPTFNTSGWDSTFTGQPLSEDAMREQAASTVARILSLRPKRVLEIGCGTGMLLFEIAPHCESYWGVDFSSAALRYLEQHLGSLGDKREGVRLFERRADDFEGFEPESFDVVFLNSTAQYFPSVHYLMRVIEASVRTVRDGGHVFLGDMRHLGLLAAFHTEVQLHRHPASAPVPRLRELVRQQVEQEQELLVSPALFDLVERDLPRVRGVRILPKRGRDPNELARYRYDVFLAVGEKRRGSEPAPDELGGQLTWLDWESNGLSLARVRAILDEGPDALGLRRVPNRRVAFAVTASRLLADPSSGIATAGRVAELAFEQAASTVDPEDLWALESSHPYRVELSWASGMSDDGDGDGDGGFDAVVKKTAGDAELDSTCFPSRTERGSVRALTDCANDPLAGSLTRGLVPRLRDFLVGRLPDYMVPPVMIVLDELPRNASGKVDRRALPSPEALRSEHAGSLVLPRDPIEEAVASIWCELLAVDELGAHDNFFELGGHSLLATRLVSRVRDVFQVEVPLRSLFEAPTVAGLAAKLKEVLGRSERETSLAPLRPEPREGPIPLSFAQQRLWFIEKLQPGTGAYHVSGGVRLRGALDLSALEGAFRDTVARHEALRTTFGRTEGGGVAQKVGTGIGAVLPLVDLGGLDATEREGRAAELALAEFRRPFDLERGPLFRCRLVRLSDSEHVLLLAMHHIVSDGWSLGVLFREVSVSYRARSRREPAFLPPVPVQYADYAIWQRRTLAGEVLERKLAFWRDALRGATVLELPTDHPRPAVQTFRGRRARRELPFELAARVEATARAEGVTTFMVLLAGFQALLHRYSGQEQIVVGTAIANRDRAELEGLVGFFVNSLAIRGDLSGRPCFRELVRRTREVTLGAYAHQDFPFEKLVEELRPERDLSRNPVVQVFFSLHNQPESRLELSGLEMAPFPTTTTATGVEAEATVTRFDLELHVFQRRGSLELSLVYASDLFEPETAERLLRHYEAMLDGATLLADAAVAVAEVELLDERERELVLGAWAFGNDAGAAPDEGTVLDAFHERVRLAPEAVAAVSEGEAITYADLDRRAGRLARHLAGLGVGLETPVGVCVPRALDLLVAILGVMKAGGAYVAMDPAYPAERLRYLLDDSRALALVAHERLVPFAEEAARIPIVCLDRDDPWSTEVHEAPKASSEIAVRGDNLAYVIYTSGSTGEPKGVAVPHRGLANLSRWHREAYRLEPSHRATQLAGLSFDASVWEVWPYLTAGASLRFPDEMTRVSPRALTAYLASERITHSFLPTPLAEAVLDESMPPDLALEALLTGGDVLHRPPKDGLPFPLFNHYGPTESAVVTTWTVVEPAPDGELRQAPPIGRPIDAVRAYVLDDEMSPTPPGVPGELYIGGAGLARGYTNRPDSTAERFVPDPFSRRGGERLYRTGDRVRFLEDGRLSFLGRADEQLKIRGFRVEPGEIEGALLEHPRVAEAAVLAREDLPGEKRLVAYVAPPFSSTEELREHLRGKLPGYMIPTVIVSLDALPRSASGKVDRKALPRPRPSASGAESHAPPTRRSERVIASLWCEVLGVPEIGIHDNFFDLGGHSLLLARLQEKLEEAFHPREISLVDLFKYPTVQAQALHLAGGESPSLQSSAARAQSRREARERRRTSRD